MMDGLFRRRSGIYVARLVVPKRHRPTVGKAEFIASTGCRELQVARIVAGELVAGWRRRLFEMDRAAIGMDLQKLSYADATLAVPGFLTLDEAESAAGISGDELLKFAQDGRLLLFACIEAKDGHGPFTREDLEPHHDIEGNDAYVLPNEEQLKLWPTLRIEREFLEVVSSHTVAYAINQAGYCECSLFERTTPIPSYIVVREPVSVTRSLLRLRAAHVEQLRRSVLADLAPSGPHATSTNASHSEQKLAERLQKRCSETIESFLIFRARSAKADSLRRIRRDCLHFVELMGDPRLAEVDRDLLLNYCNIKLPKIPSDESKVRIRLRTDNLSQTLAASDGIDLPRLSKSEIEKRAAVLSSWFAWLHSSEWITSNPAQSLLPNLAFAPTKQDRDSLLRSREIFDELDLARIFSPNLCVWYRTGRGALTSNGTYREFQPAHYWLPLIGLYTGARINEICQLSLTDLDFDVPGEEVIQIRVVDDDPELQGKKSLKNKWSTRVIPVHPHLLDLGLADYCRALKKSGYNRLFPELRFDPKKGLQRSGNQMVFDIHGTFGICQRQLSSFSQLQAYIHNRSLQQLELATAYR